MLTPRLPDKRTVVDYKSNYTREFLAVEAVALGYTNRWIKPNFCARLATANMNMDRFTRIAFVGIKEEF